MNEYLCQYYQSRIMESSPLPDSFVKDLTFHLAGPPHNRDIDIETNPEFSSLNRLLNLELHSKKDTRLVPFYPVGVLPNPASFTHLQQIYLSEQLSVRKRHSLLNKVFLDINAYFGGFNRATVRELRKSSFVLHYDENAGRRYFCLKDSRIESCSQTRMYEQKGNALCPVSSLQKFLSHLNPQSDALFQLPLPNKEAKATVWYSCNPLSSVYLGRIPGNLCKEAGVGSQSKYLSVQLRHLCRNINSMKPEITPDYSDTVFSILTEWLLSQGEDPNFETLSPSRLNTILCKYYQTMSSESSPMLTFFALELTRHLTGPPYYRDINIMSNPEFDASNRILNLNERQKKQKVFPVGNICDIPASISFTHLQQLYLNEHLSGNDQYSLQNKVWLDINVYFGGFTRQLLRDMRKSSFVLYNDDDEGRRYYRLQDDRIAFTDTRMYEQPGSPYCPITSMLRYISYLNPDTDVLFQQPCSHEDVVRNGNWYSIQPIGKNQHSAKLSSLCKHIGVKCQFRNTSVRHLSRHIQSIYSDQTPAYSDRIFRILTGVEEDPLIWTDGSYVHQKRK